MGANPVRFHKYKAIQRVNPFQMGNYMFLGTYTTTPLWSEGAVFILSFIDCIRAGEGFLLCILVFMNSLNDCSRLSIWI